MNPAELISWANAIVALVGAAAALGVQRLVVWIGRDRDVSAAVQLQGVAAELAKAASRRAEESWQRARELEKALEEERTQRVIGEKLMADKMKTLQDELNQERQLRLEAQAEMVGLRAQIEADRARLPWVKGATG